MLVILKLIGISLTLLDVRVMLLDGRIQQGQLVSLSAENVVLTDSEGATSSLPIADVMQVLVTASGEQPEKQPSSDELQLVLRDGSSVPISQAEATADDVTATAAGLGDLKLGRAFVRAVRLQPLKDEWQPQWNAFLERRNEKDLLIVAKRDGSGLDFLAGIVSSIGAEEVPFLLDGDQIPVPRSRVFGVLFAAAESTADAVAGSAVLSLTDGSTLGVSAVSMNEQQLQVTTTWGQTLQIVADRLSEIDFSSGRLHYLSDLEPLSERYYGLDPPGLEWGSLFAADQETRTGLSAQWRMSRDRFPNNGRPPLTLRGRVFRKGVCIFPRASIDYALDGRYSRFTAVVGVDDDVAFNQQKGQPVTVVELRIEADGKPVFQKLVQALDEPIELDLPMSGVTTLTVIVDFGDGHSTCDYLDLADARLIVDTTQK